MKTNVLRTKARAIAPWIVCSIATIVFLAAAAYAAAQSARTGRTRTGIAYDVQGQGPAVVLITGSNLDRRMWIREAAWLAATHTVVRYDLRAHGASDTATAPFSHLDDLVSLLDETGIRSATLIGLSAGSTIALDAALAQPSRVERLVLVGPSISGFRSSVQLPFTAALVAALQARDYAKAGEVLLASSVFAVPPESQALVRQMVMENDRLWSIPRAFLRPVERPAVDRLNELDSDACDGRRAGCFPARGSRITRAACGRRTLSGDPRRRSSAEPDLPGRVPRRSLSIPQLASATELQCRALRVSARAARRAATFSRSSKLENSVSATPV